MGNEDSITEIISFGFAGWRKDKLMLKYLLVSIILFTLFSFGMLYFSLNFSLGLANNTITTSEEVTSMLIAFYAGIAPLIIVMGLIAIFLSYLIIGRALNLCGRKSIKLNLVRFIKMILINIAQSIIAFLSLFNIKFLLIGVVGFILTVVGFIAMPIGLLAGVILTMIGVILSIIYFVIVIYNTIRLSLGEIIFVEKEESMIRALKESWIVTKGNVWTIILVEIVVVVIASIISIVAEIPVMLYTIFQTVGSVVAGSTASEIMFLNDPLFYILYIPSFVVTGYLVVVGSSVFAMLYVVLSKGKKKAK